MANTEEAFVAAVDPRMDAMLCELDRLGYNVYLEIGLEEL